MTDDRSLAITFCDDVRQELGNKFSLMGVYSMSLNVSSFPATLPKLCVNAVVSTPRKRPLSKAVLRVFRDDTMLVELAAPDEALKQARNAAGGTSVRYTLTGVIALVPLQLDGPCQLHVQVETDDETLIGDSLPVLLEAAPKPS